MRTAASTPWTQAELQVCILNACCLGGMSFAVETGGHPKDHPGLCSAELEDVEPGEAPLLRRRVRILTEENEKLHQFRVAVEEAVDAERRAHLGS